MSASGPIWITGAQGLIGHYLQQAAARFFPSSTVLALGRGDLDLEDFARVRCRYQAEQPQAIVHAAAISKAEQVSFRAVLNFILEKIWLKEGMLLL